MKTFSYKIIWEGDTKFPVKQVSFQKINYRFTQVPAGADVRIFDARRWDKYCDAQDFYRKMSIPSLVIVPDELESVWLRKLLPEDSVVLSSSFDENFTLHLVRFCINTHARQRSLKMSLTDPLTGLLPRSEISRRLRFELFMNESEKPVSLMMMDIDNFKIINDTFGFQNGDRLLRRIAGILRNCMTGENGICRMGGDEFAVVSRMNRQQAAGAADFIRREVEQLDIKDLISGVEIKGDFSVSISIGICVADTPMDSEEMFNEADSALYMAKGAGRNRVEVAGGTDNPESDPADVMIKYFENRVKVLTDRLTAALSSSSRKFVSSMAQQADTDGLTALFDRGYFNRRMKREFDRAREYKHPLSLIFVDIDFFGQVNKTYGWPTGDRALQHVAEVIKGSVRTVDWVARYGGEEMCVVLPDTNEDEANEVAERIWINAGEAQINAYDGSRFTITLSVGVAELSHKDDQLIDFIQRTSERTRCAKENGRNQICQKDRITDVPV